MPEVDAGNFCRSDKGDSQETVLELRRYWQPSRGA